MTATTHREWLLETADFFQRCNEDFETGSLCADDIDRLRTIAATLPPPYSPQPPTVEVLAEALIWIANQQEGEPHESSPRFDVWRCSERARVALRLAETMSQPPK